MSGWTGHVRFLRNNEKLIIAEKESNTGTDATDGAMAR